MTTARDRAVLNQILNPLMPTTDFELDVPVEDVKIEHEGYESSALLEAEGIKLSEGGNLDEAIQTFSRAIEACPVNPSAFNNRAQAYRLADDIENALKDLNTSLELSSKGKTAMQAFTQRASIYRIQGDNDKARDDFQKAANLGSSFAKMQLVSLNPYAAMCNKMLGEVFDNLKCAK